MMPTKINCIRWSLCAVIDNEWLNGRSLSQLAVQLTESGATLLQYRDKSSRAREMVENATEILHAIQGTDVPLIVNDRLDVAMAAGAHGVHLGRHDLPVADARRIVGKDTLIGASIQSPDDLRTTCEADYFGVGALFATSTYAGYPLVRLSTVREIRSATEKPLIGIGGIRPDHIESVLRAGCDGVAVISWILGQDNAAMRTLELASEIQRVQSVLESERETAK